MARETEASRMENPIAINHDAVGDFRRIVFSQVVDEIEEEVHFTEGQIPGDVLR